MPKGRGIRRITTVMNKVAFFVFLAFICFAWTPAASAHAQELTEANLNGIDLSLKPNDSYIKFNDGSIEAINDASQYIALFINGTLMKNAGISREGDRTLVPIRMLAESLGSRISWNEAERKATIADGPNTIELFVGSRTAKQNGRNIVLDAPAKIIGGYTYVPLRFVAEALNAKVGYFAEGGESETCIMPRITQVMVSRYPAYATPWTKEEAISKLRDQLITAYESHYNIKYVPYGEYDAKQPASPQKTGAGSVEEMDSVRRRITEELEVASENDRFYAIPTFRTFWVDKYTGEISIFYQGDILSVRRFDPYGGDTFEYAG
ncbi:MAG: copper amine oxidase N-terminal domain-containing protein [Clostridiales bacterium]|jgi:hypothetical protein|nr:copper amine oxidase N-terminal domain-containing protein [Clostridiales bacterium]